MIRVAKKLGHVLQARPITLEKVEDAPTGILLLRRGRDYHAAVWFEGVIYDPSDGILWEPLAYWHSSKYTPYRILIP